MTSLAISSHNVNPEAAENGEQVQGNSGIRCSDAPHENLPENPVTTGLSGRCSEGEYCFPMYQIGNNIDDHCTTVPNAEPCTTGHVFEVPKCSFLELKKAFAGEWSSYRAMRGRCAEGTYQLHPEFENFRQFLALMGPRPDQTYTLDRIDHNNVEYSPANCRWASKQLQTENRKSVRYLTDDSGVCLSVPEWSRRTRIDRRTILQRKRYGWSDHDCVHTPTNTRRFPTNAPPSRKSPQLAPPNPDAANCTPEYAPKAGVTSYEADELLAIFVTALKEKHKTPFYVVEPKHKKLMRDMGSLLEQGGLTARDVLALVLNDWGGRRAGFAEYASRSAHMRVPEIPTLEFLRAHVNEMGNYFLAEQGKAAARKEQETAQETAQAAQEAARKRGRRLTLVKPTPKPTTRQGWAEERGKLEQELAELEAIDRVSSDHSLRHMSLLLAGTPTDEVEPLGYVEGDELRSLREKIRATKDAIRECDGWIEQLDATPANPRLNVLKVVT